MVRMSAWVNMYRVFIKQNISLENPFTQMSCLRDEAPPPKDYSHIFPIMLNTYFDIQKGPIRYNPKLHIFKRKLILFPDKAARKSNKRRHGASAKVISCYCITMDWTPWKPFYHVSRHKQDCEQKMLYAASHLSAIIQGVPFVHQLLQIFNSGSAEVSWRSRIVGIAIGLDVEFWFFKYVIFSL